ncbi:MAG: hypothetical protein H7318_19730 [Oligoflexus sp.]|nr:hypothetical protein [Oligoflexus sp.]
MNNLVIPFGLIALELSACKSVKTGRFGDGGSAADNGMEVTSDGSSDGAEI